MDLSISFTVFILTVIRRSRKVAFRITEFNIVLWYLKNNSLVSQILFGFLEDINCFKLCLSRMLLPAGEKIGWWRHFNSRKLFICHFSKKFIML